MMKLGFWKGVRKFISLPIIYTVTLALILPLTLLYKYPESVPIFKNLLFWWGNIVLIPGLVLSGIIGASKEAVSIIIEIRNEKNQYELKRIYKEKVSLLDGHTVKNFRNNFGQGKKYIDLAELINLELPKFVTKYINKYYGNRIYRGNYFQDRLQALKSVRAAPYITKKLHSRKRISDVVTSGATMDIYSPLLSLQDQIPISTKVDTKQKAGHLNIYTGKREDRLRIFMDQYGDEHYGFSVSELGLLEPFFNIPRRTYISDKDREGKLNSSRILTDMTLPRSELVEPEDMDILEMLPLNDPSKSMLSSALVRIFLYDYEKSVPPVSSKGKNPAMYREGHNYLIRKDGSYYIYDLPTGGYSPYLLEQNINELIRTESYIFSGESSYLRNALHNLENCITTIMNIQNLEQRKAMLNYFVETTFFYPYLFSVRYSYQEARIHSTEFHEYMEMLGMPYYIHKLMITLLGEKTGNVEKQRKQQAFYEEFLPLFIETHKNHEEFIESELKAAINSKRHFKLNANHILNYMKSIDAQGKKIGENESVLTFEEKHVVVLDSSKILGQNYSIEQSI